VLAMSMLVVMLVVMFVVTSVAVSMAFLTSKSEGYGQQNRRDRTDGSGQGDLSA
jgi:hypothetical protein